MSFLRNRVNAFTWKEVTRTGNGVSHFSDLQLGRLWGPDSGPHPRSRVRAREFYVSERGKGGGVGAALGEEGWISRN